MKKKISKVFGTVITAGLAAGATMSALAYEAGDIIVRAGYANVSPNDDSDPLAVPALDISAIPGTSVEVDSGSALGITIGYMLTSTLGIELLAATPFEHDIEAVVDGEKADVGSAKHLPPTLSLVWYPMGEGNSALQPYLGVGVNYTTFFEEDVDSEVESVASDLAGIPINLDLELEDSWGLAAQIGVDYSLNDKWHLNASVRWIDINTEAELSMSGVGDIITVDDVEIDPVVYQLNVGYTF